MDVRKRTISGTLLAAGIVVSLLAGCERGELPARPAVPTQTPLPTGTFTFSPTPVFTNTSTSSSTPTHTFTVTATPVFTSTFTDTPTPTPTKVTIQAIIGPANPPNGLFLSGASGIPVFQIQLNNPGSSAVTITSLTLTASGTGDDAAGIIQISLYADNNANGIVDGGDTLSSGSVYPTNDGSAGLAVTVANSIPASGTGTFLVTDDFSPAAPPGTYQTGVVNVTDLAGVDAFGSVNFSGVPINGAVITIAAATVTPTPFVTPGSPTPTATSTDTSTPTCGCFTGTFTATPTATVTDTPTSGCGVGPSCTFTNTPVVTLTKTPTPPPTSTPVFTPTCALFCRVFPNKPLPSS